MKQECFDAVALLGSTLAVVLAVLVPVGPFDWMNGVVGLTLLVIVAAYEWKRVRVWWMQSLALSRAVALASLLIVGLVAELVVGKSSVDGQWICHSGASCQQQSKVDPLVLPVSWLALTTAFFLVDRILLQPAHEKVSDTASTTA